MQQSPYIAHYTGSGACIFTNGDSAPCDFEAKQLANGTNILACGFHDPVNYSLFGRWLTEEETPSVASFHGTTHDGCLITTNGQIDEAGRIPSNTALPKASVCSAYTPRQFSAVQAEQKHIHRFHFGLTNATIEGSEPWYEDTTRRYIPLEATTGDSIIQLALLPTTHCKETLSQIEEARGIGVTCEAVIKAHGNVADEDLIEFVDDICYVLSVALGTKVQWIYRDCYDADGKRFCRTHYNRITKPYNPLHTIDYRADGGRQFARFIEIAYRHLVAKKKSYRLKKGTIDSYLDAKAQNDYLEMRGVKLTVAMEILKTTFLNLPDCPCREFHTNPDYFEQLIPGISKTVRDVLNQSGLQRPDRQALSAAAKIRGLNRLSFNRIVKKLCNHIGLDTSHDEIDRFIKARNCLVHTGDFVASSPDRCGNSWPYDSASQEWRFLASFVDQIFLKLLGYSGPYADYTQDGYRLGAPKGYLK